MRKHNMETARSHRGLPFDPFDQLVPRNYDPAAVLERRKVFVIPDSTFDHTEKLLSDYFIKLPSIYLIPDGHNRKKLLLGGCAGSDSIYTETLFSVTGII